MQLFVVGRSDKVTLWNCASWNHIPRVGETVFLENTATASIYVVDMVSHVMDPEYPCVVVTVITEEEWRTKNGIKGDK